MFADVEAGFQLTLIIWGALAVLFFLTPWRRKRPLRRLVLILLVVGFVPGCVLITDIRAQQRYGTFTYTQHGDIGDRRVAAWIPPAAQDIRVDSRPTGFTADYRVPYPELRAFVQGHFERLADRSGYRDDPQFRSAQQHALALPDNAADWPDAVISLGGPRAPTGAGYSLEFTTATGHVSQSANYW
jgi:hypothetical protein